MLRLRSGGAGASPPGQGMRYVAVLVALWGWSMLALAVSTLGLAFTIAIVGFAAASAAMRSPRASAVIELLAFTSIALLAPAFEFVIAGAILVVIARALTMIALRAQQDLE